MCRCVRVCPIGPLTLSHKAQMEILLPLPLDEKFSLSICDVLCTMHGSLPLPLSVWHVLHGLCHDQCPSQPRQIVPYIILMMQWLIIKWSCFSNASVNAAVRHDGRRHFQRMLIATLRIPEMRECGMMAHFHCNIFSTLFFLFFSF